MRVKDCLINLGHDINSLVFESFSSMKSTPFPDIKDNCVYLYKDISDVILKGDCVTVKSYINYPFLRYGSDRHNEISFVLSDDCYVQSGVSSISHLSDVVPCGMLLTVGEWYIFNIFKRGNIYDRFNR